MFMKKSPAFLFLILISFLIHAQEGIYPAEFPSLEHIWTRIGDVSPALRSVESAELSPDGRLLLIGCEDGGLLRLYMFLSQLQDKGSLYHTISNKQLDNKDLQPNNR